MSEKETIRSFVAVDVEAPVHAAVAALQAELARVRADVRWVRAEGMHVTLKFLGSVEAARLERVRVALADALTNQPALEVRVHGAGAFPSLRRPRVLWVGLDGAGLAELADTVDAALAPLGFEAETRGFTPHMTLGRVNSWRGWPALEEQFKAHIGDDFGSSHIDVVTVYRSTLRPGGAVYTALWTIPLRQHREGGTHDSRR